MLTAPSKTFKNSDGKNVYCWNHGKEITVSLSRLDKEEDGKYKRVSIKEVNSFLNKLGVNEGFKIKKTPKAIKEEAAPVAAPKPERTPVRKPVVESAPVQATDTLGFYRKDVDLKNLRDQQRQLVESKTGTAVAKDKIVSKPGFMDELALISGSIGKPVVHERQAVSEEAEIPEQMFNDVRIEKKSVSAEGVEVVKSKNKLSVPAEVKDENVLQEGKNDRIIIGKITTGEEEVDGLGWIKIENLPTVVEEGDLNTYKYKLQGIIEAQLNKDIPRLKKIPEVANYENKTYAEVLGSEEGSEGASGAEDITGLGELTAGVQPEAGAEASPAPEGGEAGGLDGATEAIQSGMEAY